MVGERRTRLALAGSKYILNSAAAVISPWPGTAPPTTTIRSIWEMMLGSLCMALEIPVRGPRHRIVTRPGSDLMRSMMSFSLGIRCWRSMRESPRFPSPSAPWSSASSSTGASSGSVPSPTRGNLGGSSFSISDWTFCADWSAGTVPALVVTATTSSRGSNSAMINAMASSIPGSQSIMTFLDI